MTTEIIGNPSGLLANVDEANNLLVNANQSVPGYPAAGGFYTVAGKSGTVAIAAALATDVSLMSMRMAVGSARRAYVQKVRVSMSTVTAGAAGGVPSVLGIQRFTTATPTGGTARTASRLGGTAKGTATDVTDIRDNNAALTVTSVVFGEEVAWHQTPTNGAGVSILEWVHEPIAPIELGAGDGLVLRTRQAGPATATWYFTYTVHWWER